MKQRPVGDWAGFAEALLEAAFDATLTAAAILVAEREVERISVYLTTLGAGEMGNRLQWIQNALHRALVTHYDEPLDVMLVHYAEVPAEFARLEEKLSDQPRHRMSAGRLNTRLADLKGTDAYKSVAAQCGDSEADKLSATFARMDVNGDGVIDRQELMNALTSIDEEFFTSTVVNLLFNEADCDGNGAIHYAELVDWLCSEAEDIRHSICSRVP